MSIPCVSVIIPCYRQAHYLPMAVESALHQSYGSIEVIVVNDGSDDNTDEVAASYGDRIRYVKKRNGGLSSARNAGIAMATGKYLHFLDSDDALHSDAIQWMIEGMAGREDRLCVIGFREFTKSPDEDPCDSHLPPPNLRQPLPFLIDENLGPPVAFLCSRAAVISTNAFDETLPSCEDWDLWCRLAVLGADLVTIPKTGAYYRRYQGSMSTNLPRMLDSRCRVLLRLHEAICHNDVLLDACGPALAEAEQRVLRRLRIQGRSPELQRKTRAALFELRGKGIRKPTSPLRSLAERVLGYSVAEIISLLAIRVARPTLFDNYRNGYA